MEVENFIKSYRIHVFKTIDHFSMMFVSDCKTAIPLNLLHRNNNILIFIPGRKGTLKHLLTHAFTPMLINDAHMYATCSAMTVRVCGANFSGESPTALSFVKRKRALLWIFVLITSSAENRNSWVIINNVSHQNYK